MNENTAALARERRSGRDIPGGAAERRKMRERERERGERREKERVLPDDWLSGVHTGKRGHISSTFQTKRDPVVNSSTVDHRYFLPRKYL